MLSVYELKVSGDILKAIKVTEELRNVEIHNQDTVRFPEGRMKTVTCHSIL